MRLRIFTPLSKTGAWKAVLRGTRAYFFGEKHEQKVAGLQAYYGVKIGWALSIAAPFQRFTSVVRLWADKRAFARIEKLITRAKHSILIQMFIWQDDETGRAIARRLTESADRGIAIRIVKEAVGDFFETEGDFLGTRRSRDPVWKRFWTHPNITVSYEANRNHAKTYIIDGSLLLITGMNIGDQYRNQWHDYMVELRGTHFVEQYIGQTQRGTNGARIVMNTHGKKAIRPTVSSLINSARQSIVVEQAYLSDPQVLDELVAASRRGIDVTVILPQTPDVHHSANMLSVGRLMHEGEKRHMRILLYPKMIHGKIILVDRKRAFVGSANLIRSSLDDMGEVNVLLEEKPKRVLRKLRQILLADMLSCRSMTDPPSFSLIRRFLSWVQL